MAEASSAPEADKPNVLLICTDHWPGLLTRPAGHPVVMTPTIAQLARCGVHYTNAYSACPACLPARRSLMTGTTQRTQGQRTNKSTPMPDLPTLAQTFRCGGYQAFGVGKLHVVPNRDRIGFDDVVLNNEGMRKAGDHGDDWHQYVTERGYPGQVFAAGMSNVDYMTRNWHLPEDCHPTNWTTREMCRMLHRRDKRRPGFWYLSYITPHPPLTPLQAYMDLYRDVELDEPVMGEWARDFDSLPYSLRNQVIQYAIHGAPSHEQDLARRAFYAMVTHIDHQIRVVIGYLGEQALLDNTLIVFTSDHGDMLGDHGLWAKAQFYEMSARIPLIIVPPATGPAAGRLVPGATDDRLVELRDIMPTLLDVAGLDCPETVEGVSVLSDERREYLHGEMEQDIRSARMMRDRRFKLIYFPVGNRVQLFDIPADPRECHDLADDPEFAEHRARLEKKLIEHFYDKDLDWVRDGRLTGEPDRPARAGLLTHQRGMMFI